MTCAETGQANRIILGLVLVALLAIGMANCAHAPRPVLLWEVCRDACASVHGTAAAVVGSTDPTARPGCMCGAKEPGT